jgi:hypothetical protein
MHITGVEANFISVYISPVISSNGQIKLYLLLLDLSPITQYVFKMYNFCRGGCEQFYVIGYAAV